MLSGPVVTFHTLEPTINLTQPVNSLLIWSRFWNMTSSCWTLLPTWSMLPLLLVCQTHLRFPSWFFSFFFPADRQWSPTKSPPGLDQRCPQRLPQVIPSLPARYISASIFFPQFFFPSFITGALCMGWKHPSKWVPLLTQLNYLADNFPAFKLNRLYSYKCQPSDLLSPSECTVHSVHPHKSPFHSMTAVSIKLQHRYYPLRLGKPPLCSCIC